MMLCFLLDAARIQKRSLTVVSVDYSKAFNSVDRRAIPVVLRHYGVPDPDVADVMQLHHGSTAAVLTRLNKETFDTTSGLLQGDTLSPHLLIQLVGYIHGQSLVDEDRFILKQANGPTHPAVTLTALAYTDDVAITGDFASCAGRTCWKPAPVSFRGDWFEIECCKNQSSSCRI